MSRTYWALKRTDLLNTSDEKFPRLVSASGNWLAPLIFANREEARKSAREFRQHGFPVKPVRVGISIQTVIVEVD